MIHRRKAGGRSLRETVPVYPCVVQTDSARRDVVVSDALGRVEDVGLPMAQVRGRVLNQVLEVGWVRLVGADVLCRLDGVELDPQAFV